MSECLFDFPHAAVWCPACWADLTQTRIAKESKRANDLKEVELDLLAASLDSTQPTPARRPTSPPVRYVQAPVKEQPPKRGGMNIEPH
ncbi:hypothetical protein CMI37_19840 [Candidatus Pacearchaeota archaeon]|nr:hypothetical protein [Candidatus Pacearchaeota archaeon]